MSTVKDILAQKGGQVMSVGKEATVLDASRLMNEHKIGALAVLDRGQIIGIFTERDVLRRVVAEQRDPAVTKIDDVMTTEIACCRSDTPLEEVRATFRRRKIRHLPVVDEDRKVLGMISIGDLNAHDANAKEQSIHLLHEYIYGRA